MPGNHPCGMSTGIGLPAYETVHLAVEVVLNEARYLHVSVLQYLHGYPLVGATVGGLLVLHGTHTEAQPFVELDATVGQVVRVVRHLGFEYHRKVYLLDEELHGLGAVTLATLGFADGKMLDVDIIVEKPISKQSYGLQHLGLHKQAMKALVGVRIGPLAVVVASLAFRESLVKQLLYKRVVLATGVYGG